MEWFDVCELLPETCELCHFYKDATLEFTTVLTMNKNGQMGIKNRLRVKECGSPYSDGHVSGGWEWSKGGIEPEYWCPIPQNKLLHQCA